MYVVWWRRLVITVSTSDKQLLDIIFSSYLSSRNIMQHVLNPSSNFPENVHENDLVISSSNMQTVLEQSLTLGIPEALLDPLLYFSLLGNGDGEGCYIWILAAWHHLTPLADHFTPAWHNSALADVRGVHMYHMLEVVEAPNRAVPPNAVLPEAPLADRVVSGTL